MVGEAEGPALDPTLVRELIDLLRDVGSDALGELFELYLDDAPPRVARLRPLLEAGEYDELRRTAHALNGSSVSVGARTLAEYCRALEHAADRDDLAAMVDRIEREMARVQDAVRAQIRALEGQ